MAAVKKGSILDVDGHYRTTHNVYYSILRLTMEHIAYRDLFSEAKQRKGLCNLLHSSLGLIVELVCHSCVLTH